MQQTRVVLGTATPGGGFPLYGGAFAAAINAADPSLTIEPRNTKGSTENVPLLEAEALDIALVQGEVAHQALAGIGRPPARLALIAAMYATAGMFVLRSDSPARRIGDLRGKPVAFGARGSGLVILSRYILDAIGFDQDKDFQAIYLDRAGDGPAMVLDGRAAALWGGGIGWPGFSTVAAAPAGGRFIAQTPEEIERIRGKHAFLKPLTVPAGSYPGQNQPIASIGSWSWVMARPSLPEDVAYRIAAALGRARDALAARLPQARETTLANTLAAAPAPGLLHAGVMRRMREVGLVG